MPIDHIDQPLIKLVLKNLATNNIQALCASNKEEALKIIMEMIPPKSVVGFGDSLTMKEIGVVQALTEGDYEFLNPFVPGMIRAESVKIRKKAMTAEIFITGTNAVTLDGKLVNMDAVGNRIAPMLFGPDKVIIAAGRNKICYSVEDALKRIAERAAPLNVKRHNFKPSPPCATTGRCVDCSSSWRICNKITIIQRELDNDAYQPIITLIIVDEDLGL